MSKESSQFALMLRSPQLRTMPADPSASSGQCWLWCPVCGERKAYRLSAETELDELYQCPDCKNEQSFRVR